MQAWAHYTGHVALHVASAQACDHLCNPAGLRRTAAVQDHGNAHCTLNSMVTTTDLEGTIQQAYKLLVLVTVQLGTRRAGVAIGGRLQLQAAPAAAPAARLAVQLAQQV